MCNETGYRVRVENGDYFSVDEGEGSRVEEYTLQGAIEAAVEFLADTEEAAAEGNLKEPYSALEMEIVSPDGRVMSLELAKTLALCPNIKEQF